MEEEERNMNNRAEMTLVSTLETVAGLAPRIYPLAAPEAYDGTFAVYRQVSDSPIRLMFGSAKISQATYSVVLVSEQYNELLDVTASVIEALEAIEEDFILNVTVEEDDPESYEVDVDLCNTAVTVEMMYRKE